MSNLVQRLTEFSDAELLASSGMYAMLSQIWLREVDAELVTQLQETDLGEAFLEAAGNSLAADSLDDLAAEYCRLFIGPRDHLPPLQSVWARGELQSEVTTSTRSFADAIGFQSESAGGVAMFDHLGVQLGIMSHAIIAVVDARPDDTESIAFTGEFFAGI